MRKTLVSILLSVVTAAFTATTAIAVDNHVFDGKLVTVSNNILVFDHPSRGLELVPIQDISVSWKNGKFTIEMQGKAETTLFSKFLKRKITAFTLSGNGKHNPLYQTLARAFVKSPGLKPILLPAQEVQSKWVDDSGIQHTVITPRKRSETTKKLVERHKELVDAMKAAFPPKKQR